MGFVEIFQFSRQIFLEIHRFNRDYLEAPDVPLPYNVKNFREKDFQRNLKKNFK